jgi:hypothetical protein
MAAYFQEVRQLEDKFNGLELNHIPRRLNEAADMLAKMAFGQELVPTGIFASDQHKPSIYYEKPGQTGSEPLALGLGANQPLTPSDLEVLELEQDPVAEPDPSTDWRTPYLDCLLREVLLTNKIDARWLACYAKSFTIIEGSSTSEATPRSCSTTSPLNRGGGC